MLDLHGATVLLQWATGGLLFTWVTTRRREVGLGYGWTMRLTFGLMALAALGLGLRYGVRPIREIGSAGVVLIAKQERISPSSSGVSHSAFCASVP